MTIPDFHKAIRDHYVANVEDVDTTVPVAYDNLPDPHTDEDIMWVKWTILTGETRQVEISGASKNRERTTGIAIAMIFRKVQSGTKDPHVYAELVRTAFAQITLTDDGGEKIKFKSVSVRNLGRSEDDKWWQVNVICSFYYDDKPS